MDKTRATSAVKSKPAKRIKYFLPGTFLFKKQQQFHKMIVFLQKLQNARFAYDCLTFREAV